jgi:polyhydroxyalkanoate synthesis regulator phasin
MAMKKKMKKRTFRRPVAQLKRMAHPRTAENRIKKTWNQTVEALTSAEARMEKEIRGLLKRNKISMKDGATMMKDVRALVVRERKRGMKELEARFATLQTRVRKERKNVSKRVDDAVQGALAAFNLPSRHEVHELTRKVNELSKKIDSFKR